MSQSSKTETRLNDYSGKHEQNSVDKPTLTKTPEREEGPKKK